MRRAIGSAPLAPLVLAALLAACGSSSGNDAGADAPADAPADVVQVDGAPDTAVPVDAPDAPPADAPALDVVDAAAGDLGADAEDAPAPDAPEVPDVPEDAPTTPDVVDAGTDAAGDVATDAADVVDDAPPACALTRCGGECVSLATSTAHCGACDARCVFASMSPHASATCAAGRCGATCETGYANCDGNVANGCEASLSSATSCGRCGNDCTTMGAPANARRACVLGACGFECLPGFADCDGSGANGGNGCETNTLTSATSCGACGARCQAQPNRTVACVAGACAPGACLTGFADCDGRADNGCEVNLTNDTLHCGACGTTCPTPSTFQNGIAVCRNRACAASCAEFFADCDGMLANGCETSIRNNNAHCGFCRSACPNGQTCRGSACVP